MLALAILFGGVEFILWGRTHWEDGVPLLVVLLLASYHLLKAPLSSVASKPSRVTGWAMLALAAGAMAASAFLFQAPLPGHRELVPMLGKNGAILLLTMAILLREDGFPAAGKSLPLLLLAVLILPLYELLLLEFSYPLRLLSTWVSVILLNLCSYHVHSDGTTLLWGNQTLSITDACSGISLLGLFFLVEYLIAQPLGIASWKKWCWSSLLLIWVTLGNALRLLLTFFLYRFLGERVFEARIHFLLGCFFVVITSLLIWFSSFLFKLDQHPSEEA